MPHEPWVRASGSGESPVRGRLHLQWWLPQPLLNDEVLASWCGSGSSLYSSQPTPQTLNMQPRKDNQVRSVFSGKHLFPGSLPNCDITSCPGLKRPSDSQSSERPPGKTLKADASQTAPAGHPSSVPQQAAASNPAPPHAAANGGEQAASLKKAEMEQLQQKIQQKQACLRPQLAEWAGSVQQASTHNLCLQAELRAQLQGSNAVEAQRQQQKARDKARLDAGFSEVRSQSGLPLLVLLGTWTGQHCSA